jgi:hypothetical protein
VLYSTLLGTEHSYCMFLYRYVLVVSLAVLCGPLLVIAYSYVSLSASRTAIYHSLCVVVSSLQLDVLKRKVDTYALAATFICLVQVTAYTVTDRHSACTGCFHLFLW